MGVRVEGRVVAEILSFFFFVNLTWKVVGINGFLLRFISAPVVDAMVFIILFNFSE